MKLNIYILIVISMFSLAACCNVQHSPNRVCEYLKDAEFQCETTERKEEVYSLFQDMLNLRPEQLKKKVYNDYQGTPQWSAHYFLERHFVPASQKFLDEDTFYEDLQDPCAKKIIEEWLQKIGPLRN